MAKKPAASNTPPANDDQKPGTPPAVDVTSPSEPAKMPQIDYDLLEDGRITRTDKDSTLHVANYDRKTKTVAFISDETLKFRPPTIAFLNRKDIEVDHIVLKDVGADKVDEATIPPMPKKSMMHGDKTPAVVEWYRKYKPKEYAARYGVQGPGSVTKYRKVENEKKPGTFTTEPYEQEAIISTRKTHLTEKPEANIAGNSEYTSDDSIPKGRG
jgi:hypothetical protein